MVSSVTLDPHTIIKQAGMMGHATSNAAGGALGSGYVSGSVNDVFTAEVTGQNRRTRASIWSLVSPYTLIQSQNKQV